jgi:hypothetical protein
MFEIIMLTSTTVERECEPLDSLCASKAKKESRIQGAIPGGKSSSRKEKTKGKQNVRWTCMCAS